MRRLLRAFVIFVVAVCAALAVTAYSISRRGLGTGAEPTGVETLLARGMRWLATPGSVRSAVNPVLPTEEVVGEALRHFADHCAVCHANDGSGDTQMGRNLYPRAPDMRAAATQNLSDGELFSIIENGIRLTGMPGWSTGTSEGERASWSLVHFIRRLPTLTADEIARMEELNPKSAEQFRQDEEARRFLAGEDVAPAAPVAHEHAR